MPLYEYECEACKQRFEVIQKFSDAGPETCARCGKGPVHRQISTPAIQFKGSGWYITDYAKSGSRTSKDSKDHAPTSSSSTSSSESKPETKSETKTETKTESKSTSES